jgi:hypothetical protein
MNRFSKGLLVAMMATAVVVANAQVNPTQVNITAKTSFGGGDGWLAPGEGGITWLTTDNNQRSMAWDPITAQLLVTNGAGVRIVNGTTGVSSTFMNVAGITGGDRAINQVGVSDDGQVFVSNLRSNLSTGNFKLYRFAGVDNTTASTTIYDGSPISPTTAARLGDSMDVFGSGNNVNIAAGYNAGSTGVNRSGFGEFNWNGTSTTAFDRTGIGANGDFRLGINYFNGSVVMGVQNATAPGVRVSSSGSLFRTITLADPNERALDTKLINGYQMLATIQSNSNTVRLYNLSQLMGSNATASVSPLVLNGNVATTSINLTTSFVANGNANSDIAWGNVVGNTATLYALNTNNGIQAFDVTVVPEPGTMAALGLGAAALLRRRRKNAAK